MILLARVPNVLAVSPDVPAKTLKEFVALAKAKPDTITYGSAGNGSSGHLAMEYFMAESAIKATHVPYKGTADVAGHSRRSRAGDVYRRTCTHGPDQRRKTASTRGGLA